VQVSAPRTLNKNRIPRDIRYFIYRLSHVESSDFLGEKYYILVNILIEELIFYSWNLFRQTSNN
jgi:hypothetical protein